LLLISNEVLAWNALDCGVKCLERGNFDAAIYNLNECLKLTPKDPIAHWNLALALLCTGDYENGFNELEWRWRVFDWCWGLLPKDIGRVSELPLWHGEELANRRVLYYHEQGYGDAILMMRYLPLLIDAGAEIIALTLRPLQRLVESFGVQTILELPENLRENFDYRCPVFGPIPAFGHTINDIPNAPYISIKGWNIKPNTLGICWSGRTQQEFDLEGFLKYLLPANHEVFSLQPGKVNDCVVPLMAEDFYDTAKVIERMEHIVTIDTAVANLAGAMGHPSTHLLIPYRSDWRWYRSDIWYPKIKVYREDKNNDPWQAVRSHLGYH